MAFDPSPDEIADRYAETRTRVTDVARSLTDEQIAVPVPGTPDWTVIDC
jgi:hypothetical protein